MPAITTRVVPRAPGNGARVTLVVSEVAELVKVGPHGYVHGWIKVDPSDNIDRGKITNEHLAKPARDIISSLKADPITPIPADDYNPAQGYEAAPLIDVAVKHGEAGRYDDMMTGLAVARDSLSKDHLDTDAQRLDRMITSTSRIARYNSGQPEPLTRLDKDDFTAPHDDRGNGKSYNQTVKNVITHLNASDGDLRALANEDGRHDTDNMSGDGLKRTIVEGYINSWRGSSGGPAQVAMVSHVADRLGRPYELEDSEKRTNAYIAARPAVQRAAHAIGDAMYATTQEWLKDNGVKNVELYRASRGADWDKKRPFTSWSTMSGWTREGNPGGTRHESVPAERVFSLPPTGFGTYAESEAVVLPSLPGEADHVLKSVQKANLVKVGPEGYIHGWIKVGTVTTSDVSFDARSGNIVHTASGTVIARTQPLPNTKRGKIQRVRVTMESTGKSDDVSRDNALGVAAYEHNNAVMAAHAAAASKPAAPAPQPRTVEPVTALASLAVPPHLDAMSPEETRHPGRFANYGADDLYKPPAHPERRPSPLYHGSRTPIKPGTILDSKHNPRFGLSQAGYAYATYSPEDAVRYATKPPKYQKLTGSPHFYHVEPVGPYGPDPANTGASVRSESGFRVLNEIPLEQAKTLPEPGTYSSNWGNYPLTHYPSYIGADEQYREDEDAIDQAWYGRQAPAADITKDAADLSDPSPVDATHVYENLLANYPPHAISWVKTMPWIGPVNVPLDSIDWDGQKTWAASHQTKRVKKFRARIRGAGKDVNPVTLVQVPGNDKRVIIDGHHRALAFKAENKPVKAYIGTAPSDNSDDPWFKSHDFQYAHGSNSANKAAEFTGNSAVKCGILKPVAVVSPESGVSKAAGLPTVWAFANTPELVKVGEEGYIHGWVCVRPPCGHVGDKVTHPVHGDGTIRGVNSDGSMIARFSDGTFDRLGDESQVALAPRPPVTTELASMPGTGTVKPAVFTHRDGRINRSDEVPEAWNRLTPAEQEKLRGHEIHVAEGRDIYPVISDLGINVSAAHEDYGTATGLAHENKILVTRRGLAGGDLDHELGHALDQLNRSRGSNSWPYIHADSAARRETKGDPRLSPHFDQKQNKDAAKERFAELFGQHSRGIRRYDLGMKLSPQTSQLITDFFDEYRNTGTDEAKALKIAALEPVSFAEKNASGKVKLRIADLVKVGPEGYIHGYICVRPPCGPQYTEASFNSGKGTVEHEGIQIGKMRKNADGTYSMTHVEAGGRQKLDARYATRQDAAKSIALYHNMWALQNSTRGFSAEDAAISHNMARAITAMRTGDHDGAASGLEAAANDADKTGNRRFSTHARELAAAIRDAPEAVTEVASWKAPKSGSLDRVNAAISDAKNATTPVSPTARKLDEAARLLSTGDTAGALEIVQAALSNLEETHTRYADTGIGTALIDNRITHVRDVLDQIKALRGDQPESPAKFDPAPHIAVFQALLAEPGVHSLQGMHVETQLVNAIESLNRGSVKAAYSGFAFAEDAARYNHLDDIADRIRAAADKLRDDYGTFEARRIAAMPPGWEKDLLTDPKYVKPQNGYEVTAYGKDGAPLSLHPTAPKYDVPRYFTTQRDVDDFVRDNSAAYRYDEYWQAHGRGKPTVKTKLKNYSVRQVENGQVASGFPETREPGETNDYGDPNGDAVASIPIRFAPLGNDVWNAFNNPHTNEAARTKVAAEIRGQLRHQDSLAPAVVRNTQITVTNEPQTRAGGKKSTLADFRSSYPNPPFHGVMRVTPEIFSAINKYSADNVISNSRNGTWWVPSDEKWKLSDVMIAHEIGHGVAGKAWGTGGVPQDAHFWDAFASVVGRGMYPVPRSDSGEFDAKTASKWIANNKITLTKSVSEYGTTNAAELMAELWAEYTMRENPRIAARLYGDLATARLKEQDEAEKAEAAA
jgi:hypothetical protein